MYSIIYYKKPEIVICDIIAQDALGLGTMFVIKVKGVSEKTVALRESRNAAVAQIYQ